ncbi:DUF6011 domain-containing protein [Streptomyces sp. S07_1.15]|uniref:DUF6011 domain-containing protein n=1 Tax=Streptomyces sp. S07_1.15 TaxID=2873925 RepID=UPI001D13B232|nr:DUF6011 domain-containing protein [Streptomyces sp. S07_1.15]MCC3652712.1 DUF6011 domain-containing protein [Streptomyces sp. S07_1.15]
MTKTEATQTANCLRCGRALRAPRSIANGYGRTCKAKVREAARAEVIAAHKPAQVAKALELIELGGIVAVRGRRVFRTVSSDGTRTYLSAPQACNCAAGLKAKHVCFHRIAAQIVAAA